MLRDLLRGHKRIPNEILDHKHVLAVWFIIFFEKFAMSKTNLHKTTSLAQYLVESEVDVLSRKGSLFVI